LFVAAYPPSEVIRAAMDSLGAMQLPDHRLTPEDQVHVTLQFIGDVPAREMEWVCESVRRAAAGIGAITLRPGGLIALPERGPARLMALETDGPPALIELHQRLVVRLAREPRGKDEKGRAYRPHMTLARFRSPVDRRRLRPSVAHAMERGGPAERIKGAEAFDVKRIALMRSTLSPAGTAHHVVEWVGL